MAERRANAYDRFVRPVSRHAEERDNFGRYPRSEEEWRDRVAFLRACYHLEPYTQDELDALHLFWAEDDNEYDLARTRRLIRDFAFVIDQNADHLIRGGATLETAEADDDTSAVLAALLAQGEAICARSKLKRLLGPMAHDYCLERVGVEIQQASPGVCRLVMHRSETFTAIYDDATGLDLVEVRIVQEFYDAEDLDDRGDFQLHSSKLRRYVRRLTPTEVIVTIDGERIEEESGPHPLGVVPFVNLVYRPTQEIAHGVSAAHGLEMGLAVVDSLFTQAHAIGTRYADPIMLGKNVDLSGSNVEKFGRRMSWGTKGDVETSVTYLEPDMKGIKGILDVIERLHDQSRATLPEFGLFKSGGNMSGEALKTLASAFVAKVEGAREGFFDGLSEAVGIAAAWEKGVAYDLDTPAFRFDVGPVLPVDAQAEIALVMDVKDAKLITDADAIRHLQRLGFIPEHHDPEEYAMQVQDLTAQRPAEFMAPAETTTAAGSVDTMAADIEDAATTLRAAIGGDPDALAAAIEQALAVLVPQNQE